MEKDSEEDKEWLAECSDEELYNYRYGVWSLPFNIKDKIFSSI